MDNIKTGNLIKELRKEKGITQKELADLLYITDRAVSKWERGLCAPDISLLEPLAKALDVSIIDLIAGTIVTQTEYTKDLEESTKNVIDYSRNEITYKIRSVRKKYLSIITICLVSAIVICTFLLWQGGYLFIIDQSVSPNKNMRITVYNKALEGNSFSMENATSTIMEYMDDKDKSVRITYENCAYQGIWWAPDSKKYVISLKYEDDVHLSLAWIEKNSESNLSAYLSIGVEMTELSKYGYAITDIFPKVEYQFLQWALDSESMLIYYSFSDKANNMHDGYFWYNCLNGTVSALFEMDT